MSQKLKLSNILPLVFFIIALAFFFWVRDANATKPKPPPPQPQEQSQRQEQGQHQDQEANGYGGFGEGGDSFSDVQVETGDVSIDAGEQSMRSDTNYTNISEHTFYSYAQSNRPATGCFVSGDAAGGESGKFGALGLYWLNTNCWMDALARQERDVVINAELKCYGRKYRNALTWDMKGNKRERTARCVEKVSQSGLAMIEQEKAIMQAEIDNYKTEEKKQRAYMHKIEKHKDALEREVSEHRLQEAVNK